MGGILTKIVGIDLGTTYSYYLWISDSFENDVLQDYAFGNIEYSTGFYQTSD